MNVSVMAIGWLCLGDEIVLDLLTPQEVEELINAESTHGLQELAREFLQDIQDAR